MASYTTNLNLKKPAGSENVAIGDINNNMDTIDNAYGTLNSKLNGGIIKNLSINIHSGDTVFNIGNGVRAMLQIIDSSPGNCGLYYIISTSQSIVYVKEIMAAQNITLTGETGSLTINIPNGTRAIIFTSAINDFLGITVST